MRASEGLAKANGPVWAFLPLSSHAILPASVCGFGFHAAPSQGANQAAPQVFELFLGSNPGVERKRVCENLVSSRTVATSV
jgi:hypothetical protein